MRGAENVEVGVVIQIDEFCFGDFEVAREKGGAKVATAVGIEDPCERRVGRVGFAGKLALGEEDVVVSVFIDVADGERGSGSDFVGEEFAAGPGFCQFGFGFAFIPINGTARSLGRNNDLGIGAVAETADRAATRDRADTSGMEDHAVLSFQPKISGEQIEIAVDVQVHRGDGMQSAGKIAGWRKELASDPV